MKTVQLKFVHFNVFNLYLTKRKVKLIIIIELAWGVSGNKDKTRIAE